MTPEQSASIATAISEHSTTIASVGIATLTVIVGIQVFKWIRRVF